ncbi:sulfatase-like hydrolase/transferase [Microlunatus parietis]|uniref:Arylsulfatase A-like enzyme n=1 Tax=Microlunatus parietis TaxID=682979 RepID=A0A7Y9LBW0_9ACTN|nr:sulfatase-like hydrolase/transferase [Microlunatus parietis]NYE71263.1 arylsulfatase A-like enzyme [Microlunatus parietis]
MPPNVLIIQADQFRADCLGAAGHPDVRTPALDRLAADGVRFRNAYSTFPVCTPSRYSLLSGLQVRQHGGWTNRCTLAPGIDTFPRALRRAGYRTAAVGKMHFTPTYLDVGYDKLELAEQDGPGRYDDDYHRELAAAGLAPVTDLVDQEWEFRDQAPGSYWETYGSGTSDLPEAWHSTTWIGERARRAVAGWSAKTGELLHVSFVKPHHPFDPPAGWAEAYDPDALTLLPGWTAGIPAADERYRQRYFDYGPLTEPILRRVMAHYYATITQLDHQVGLLLDELRRRGRYDDTLIIFTADHGEYLGFHHLLLKDGPMYDPVIKVPLVIKFPGSRRSGEVNDRLVSMIDVAPTVLTACRAEPENPWPGRDLADPAAGHRYVFAEDRRQERAIMIRSERYKLLWSDAAGKSLFDLVADPYEFTDLAADPAHAEALAELREARARWALHEATPPTYLDPAAPVRAELTDGRAERRDLFATAVARALAPDPA